MHSNKDPAEVPEHSLVEINGVLSIRIGEEWKPARSYMTLKDVRIRLKEILDADFDMKRAYVDNISMALYDRIKPDDDHQAATKIALGLEPFEVFDVTNKSHRDAMAANILNLFLSE